MLDNSSRSTRRLARIALMAALIAVGASIQFPLGPVPLSMQTFFVILVGFVLGPMDGLFAALLYLVLGAIGLPVFAGGESGLPKLLGPTGGFLFSFAPMAAVAGVATRGARPLTWGAGLYWGGLASLLAFVVGVPWLKIVTEMSWQQTLSVGFWPFLPGAVIKLALAMVSYHFLYKRGWISET